MRGLAWILAGIGAFLWGSTALGIAVSLADKGAEGWWVLLPLAAIPVVGVTVAALKQLQRNAPKEERISASESQPSPRASPLTSESEPSRTGSIDPLTPREMEVLGLISRGHTNRQIAQGLFISTATVKTHINAICRKLDADNRTQAVSRARARGLLGD